MLTLLQNTNLAVRFGLELALLTAVGYTAWRTIPTGAVRVVAAVVLPVLVAVVWATVVHGSGVPSVVQVGIQVVLFTAAACGLAAVHHARLGASFAALVILNAVLMSAWAQ